MAELDEQDLILWKNERKRQVKDGTLLREMALISGVIEAARKEWHWIDKNPMAGVSKPSKPLGRERVISGWEIRRILRQMGWAQTGPLKAAKHRVARAFIHALLTGMRAGEICNLRWKDVHKTYCQLHNGETKTGLGRKVPLSKTARKNLEFMRGYDDEFVFGLNEGTLDVIFRRNRERAGLSGFTFHDSRHTAATRIAQVLHVLDLCKMFGWTDPKRAMIYYNPTADQIADRLDGVGVTPSYGGFSASPIQLPR